MRSLRLTPWLVIALLLGGAHGLFAEPDAPTAGGSLYQNPRLGLRLTGPAGWKMTPEKEVAVGWVRLVTFSDDSSGVDATLSMRERQNGTVEDLRLSAEREWQADRTITITSRQTVAATPQAPHASVVLEGTQVVTPEAAKPKPGEVPPPPPTPVAWTLRGTYWLAPGYEYVLYARARSTLWSRVAPKIDEIRASFGVAARETGPAGEGGFQHETLGFSCRFPSGYAVRIPHVKDQVVEFKGVGADAPVLGIFRFQGDFPVENDAQGLVKYYVEDQSGEAKAQPLTVGGRPGWLVTAHAVLDGKPSTVLIAVTKRGRDEFFRIRASMPKEAETKGRAVFDAFLSTLQIGAAPR
jgi:hypothetical protein